MRRAARAWPPPSSAPRFELGGDARRPALPQRAPRSPPPRSSRPIERGGLAARARRSLLREAVRHRPRKRARGSNGIKSIEVFDEHQIFRIDHFLGKEAALITSSRCASPMGSSSRSGTETTSITCRSRCPSSSGSSSAHRVLRADGRLPRHGGHPPVPSAGVRRHGAANRADPVRDQPWRREPSLPLAAPARPRARSFAASTRAIARSRGSIPSRRPRPWSRFAARSTTGAGPVSPSTYGRASGSPSRAGSSRSPSGTAQEHVSR